jgi:hypothetical protein
MSQQARSQSSAPTTTTPQVFLKRRAEDGRVVVVPVGEAELATVAKPTVEAVTPVTGAVCPQYQTKSGPWYQDRSARPEPRYQREVCRRSHSGGSAFGTSGRGGYTRPDRSVARRAGA